MDGVRSMLENLKAAVDGETYEYTTMYPPMIKQAEAVHARLYAMALDAVKSGKDLPATAFYLCPVCGHIELGQPPASCPICDAKGKRFTQM